MQFPTVRVLIADDYDPWLRFAALALSGRENTQIVGQAVNGLMAVQKASELRPDVVILDIGLPDIGGITVARVILDEAPKTKILFLTQNTSADMVREALRTGAKGYVVKSRAGRDFLPAFDCVLRDEMYISAIVSPQGRRAYAENVSQGTCSNLPVEVDKQG